MHVLLYIDCFSIVCKVQPDVPSLIHETRRSSSENAMELVFCLGKMAMSEPIATFSWLDCSLLEISDTEKG